MNVTVAMEVMPDYIVRVATIGALVAFFAFSLVFFFKKDVKENENRSVAPFLFFVIGLYTFLSMFTISSEWKVDELNRIETELESMTAVDLIIDASHKDLLDDGDIVRMVNFYYDGSLYEGKLATQDEEVSFLIPTELDSGVFVPYDEDILNSY